MKTTEIASHLSHGGPGSGRYPLGSGERPFQRSGHGRNMRRKSSSSQDSSDTGAKKESKLKKALSKASDVKNRFIGKNKNGDSDQQSNITLKRQRINVKKLSDEELNARIKRLERENQLLKLMGKEQKPELTQKTEKFVTDLIDNTLNEIGRKVITPMAAGMFTYELKKAAARKENRKIRRQNAAESDPKKQKSLIEVDFMQEVFRNVNKEKKK